LNTEVKKISYEILTNSCSVVTIGRTDNGMKIKLHILVKYSGENIPFDQSVIKRCIMYTAMC
jgi:hypothetical protein